MALLSPAYLLKHPIRSGLLWAAFFIPAIVFLSVLQGRTEKLPFLIVFAIPSGIAWGYGMRLWLKRKADHAL